MPPRSIGSAIALVSLSALTAIEAGGCHKRPEPLGSLTRSALPLVAQAIGSNPIESNYALSDYGLAPRPDLKHICGHYDLQTDGRLTTWDLFAGPTEATQLRREVDQDLERVARSAKSRSRQGEVTLVVDSGRHFEWPRSCPKSLARGAQSVLVASRVL
jgi:hypothetical protein